MVLITPHRGVQKLRSRSTLRVSLPLMMRFAAIAGAMYYFVALIERARSASGVISITNVTECVHICARCISYRHITVVNSITYHYVCLLY